MSKIGELLKQVENQRLEFWKVGDKIHQINRIPEQASDKHGHRRVIHNADGSKEAEDFISPEEYESIKSKGERVDANKVGSKK